MIIDYSQYRLWRKCPWRWWLRYEQGWKRKYYGQRDDAAAVGTLVHAAQESFLLTRVPEIPVEALQEVDPTPEAALIAQKMVQDWVREYGGDQWEVEVLEEPLPISVDGNSHPSMQIGLAKVDSVMRVHTEMAIPDGLGGQLWLEPGVYARDYKTRSSQQGRDKWRAAWNMDMQATFQLLACDERWPNQVRGMLVDVIEQPPTYKPQRTCKGCKTKSDYYAWVATSTPGEFKCPWCGAQQKLQPPKDKAEVGESMLWRMLVQRSPEQLHAGLQRILRVREQMQEAAAYMKDLGASRWVTAQGPYAAPEMNETSCYDLIFGACEFADFCVEGAMPHENERLYQVNDPRDYISRKYIPGAGATNGTAQASA